MALAEQRSVLQVVAGGDGEGQAPAVVLEVAGEHSRLSASSDWILPLA